jgi:hypothetical protein
MPIIPIFTASPALNLDISQTPKKDMGRSNFPWLKGNSLSVCVGNTLYSRISPNSINVYEYVNLPPELTSYCGYYSFEKKGLVVAPPQILILER